MSLVAVVMGSKSDAPTMQDCLDVLDQLEIPYESLVASAHRAPDKVREFARSAADKGIEVIIAAAGGAAALPGAIKAHTAVPVIGVPLASSDLQGVDALYAIVQMPPGVPVACMAIGKWGARNAALFAVEILSLKHESISAKYATYRNIQAEAAR